MTFREPRIYLYAAAHGGRLERSPNALTLFRIPDAMNSRSKLFRLALLALALSLLLALPTPRRSSARQAEGLTRGAVGIRVEGGKELKLYEKSYALVIGVSDYTRGWPRLPGVKKDVEEVARALERHGFLVTKVENPDSAQLEKSFKEFIDAHGREVETRLLFYFAGHGHTVKQSYGEEMGYIVPTDAPLPARDPSGFMSKAMDMQQMELYARRVQSKHALFLFDSCFSGALFALSRAVPDAISYKTARPVRQFITSGSADEQVPDQSIFRRQFVEALDGEADLNRDGYVTGTELGEFLQDKVINYSRNAQHPQYGKLRNPNLDKGDFVFALAATSTPKVREVKKLYVLAIGISRYAVHDEGLQDLQFADRDATEFASEIRRQKGLLYSDVVVRTLTNEQAKRADVLGGFAWIQEVAGDKDVSMIFLAGHGTPDPFAARNLYFMPHDAALRNMARTAIPFSDIRQAALVTKGRVVVFADMAHSGMLPAPGIEKGGLRLLDPDDGTIFFTACDTNEPSQESPRWGGGHGVFTKYLLDGLRGAADGEEVTVSKLYAYLSSRVRADTSFRQNPKLFMSHPQLDFPLALRP